MATCSTWRSGCRWSTRKDFAEAKAWCEAHPDDIVGAYLQSKEALIIWTMKAAMDLNAQGIRLNCISPGPTDTPMMPAFEDMAGGGQIIDLFAQGLGRRSTPAEQGWPMIFLNSDAASYISGENLNTDGGTVSAMTTGRLVLDFDPESLEHVATRVLSARARPARGSRPAAARPRT